VEVPQWRFPVGGFPLEGSQEGGFTVEFSQSPLHLQLTCGPLAANSGPTRAYCRAKFSVLSKDSAIWLCLGLGRTGCHLHSTCAPHAHDRDFPSAETTSSIDALGHTGCCLASSIGARCKFGSRRAHYGRPRLDRRRSYFTNGSFKLEMAAQRACRLCRAYTIALFVQGAQYFPISLPAGGT
jgi:hypothetical protein